MPTSCTIDPSTGFAPDFDSSLAAQFWMSAFVPILILFFTSKGISAVVDFLKKA